MDIWESLVIESGKCCFRQIGPLRIWIRYIADEWFVAFERVPSDSEVVRNEVLTEIPKHCIWTRYVLPPDQHKVTLFPLTPDRSIVVKPESSLKIASGADAQFFVLFPLWVKVTGGRENPVTFAEVPSQILSNTWFGEPHEGELCYFLKTWAKRSLDGLTPRPYWIVCPVDIRNTSGTLLDFTRLCIRTEYLSIFKGKQWLWTNKVHVQFRGAHQTSRIKYDNEAPDFEPDCRLLGEPRQKVPKEFSIKSFDTFNIFTGG